MELLDVLKKRYSVKKFDPTKRISDEDLEKIKDLLQLSASSTNAQPWHFVIASSDEAKERVSKATKGFYSFNEAKIRDASHVIVFCSRTDITEEFLLHVLDKEEQDGRFTEKQFKDNQHMGRLTFVNMHRYDNKDLQHWCEKQVYLNMGSFLLGVAELGIDAVPMEGFDAKVLDEELGLREKGFTSIGIVSVGYHAESDFNAKLPKSRLSKEEIIEVI